MLDKNYRACSPIFGSDKLDEKSDDRSIMPSETFWKFINDYCEWGLKFFPCEKRSMHEVIAKEEGMNFFKDNHKSFHRRMLMEVCNLNNYEPVRNFLRSKNIQDKIKCLKHVIMKGKKFYDSILSSDLVPGLDEVTAPDVRIPVYAIDFEALYEDWKKSLEDAKDVLDAV